MRSCEDHVTTDDDRPQEVAEGGLDGDSPLRVDLHAFGEAPTTASPCGRSEAALLARLEQGIDRGQAVAHPGQPVVR